MHLFKHSLFRLKITVGCLTSTYPSIHVEDTFKITVGCLWSTFPSIHFSLDEDTLEITVGCPLCAYPSIRKNSQDHGRLPAVRISKHSPSHHVETLSRSRSAQKKKERDLFITGIFPARNLFFITVLNKFQKLAAGVNYSALQFSTLIPKQ